MGYHVYNPYVTAFIATIGGMLFGFDISSVSAFVDDDDYRSYFHNPSSIAQGGITASMAGGSFLGSLVAGFISDKLGRRPTIQISSIIWIIGAAIQCSAQNQGQLIAGRVIAGLAIGLASTQVPVYVAELSPKNIRGRLVGLFQWSVTWGIMIMFYISYGCSKINGPASFRTAWGIQMVPGLLLFLGTLILPESPRWLAARDRWEEAINIVAHVQAGGDVNDPNVMVEIEEIKEAVRIERESKHITIMDLFRKGSLNRTMVGLWAQIWQQLTGMNVMMYYIVTIFSMAGYSGDANLVSSSIQYVLNMVMTVPALLFIDRWGRRRLLLAGSILMMIWLIITTILLGVFADHVDSVNGNDQIRLLIPDNHKDAAKAVIACSYLFVCSFAPTWGPGIWIYNSEIFPLKQRAVANGLTGAANWIFNFALAMFVPTAFKNITYKTYIIFAVFCFAMTIHVFFLFPETKGKTLEEIEQMWEANVPAWRSSSWEPRRPSLTDIKAVGEAGPTTFDKRVGEHDEKAQPEGEQV
uniref:ARAD1B12496p n=1 Tax=Blastobotrys adeninivorans TaxID=409370 RepID=A0A060TB35_BLAAD